MVRRAVAGARFNGRFGAHGRSATFIEAHKGEYVSKL